QFFFSTRAPDVDLWVKVLDLAPDGTAYSIMSPGLDVVRASYRSGRVKRQLLQNRFVYQIDFDNLLTANTFKRGHRIRVAVMTSFAPGFSTNLQTGQLEATSAKGRITPVAIYHEDLYPFRLILPVVPASVMLSGT